MLYPRLTTNASGYPEKEAFDHRGSEHLDLSQGEIHLIDRKRRPDTQKLNCISLALGTT
jgi:hypothetical protein